MTHITKRSPPGKRTAVPTFVDSVENDANAEPAEWFVQLQSRKATQAERSQLRSLAQSLAMRRRWVQERLGELTTAGI